MSARILFVAFTREVPICPVQRDFIDFVNGGEVPEGRCIGAFVNFHIATQAVENAHDIDRMREHEVDWLLNPLHPHERRAILCTQAHYGKPAKGVVYGWVEPVELERRSFDRRG